MRLGVACLAVSAAFLLPSLAAARPDPVTWCGSDEVTQNRLPDLEQAADQQVRFVYAVPADGVDSFLADASGIATDAAWIDQWWQAQDPTRTPRFARYGFPGCTSQFGALDIGFVRLAQPASFYLLGSTPSVRLDESLAGDFPSSQKTIVYYDGPIQDQTVCGETDYLSDTQGGDEGIAYVYLQSGCNLGPPGSGGTAEVAAHELLHNLGAVPSGAPNECPDSASHVCDSDQDIMYPYIAQTSALDAVLLDVGRDDYYGHSGSWWDVRSSQWLTHLPQHPFALDVAGSGQIYAAAGTTQLPCEGGCPSLTLDDGESVSVTAVPADGWRFAGWSGSCTGTAPACTIVVDGATAATATFVRETVTLSVSVAGAGRVTSAPAGISCPRACRATLTGSSVRLVARASRGWRFAGWGGACAGVRRACTVRAHGAVRARFSRATTSGRRTRRAPPG